jgi:putative transposase
MQNASTINTGRSVIFALSVHLVFVTKYRRGVITTRVREHLRASLASVCTDFGATLKELDGEDDHLHLLVSYPPKVAISKLVNSLKGVSSRYLRQANYPEVTRALWGGQFWSPSYFAASCGGATLDVIASYIQNQRLSGVEKRRAALHPGPEGPGFRAVS